MAEWAHLVRQSIVDLSVKSRPRVEMGIVHWLDALTWPASLVLKVIRATVRIVGGVIRQRA
jgi:hypothetical protein